jgi:tRNA threonylcarbamoyladenosine biosynthesis protein TsaB
MRILGLDTATFTSSAAVLDGDGRLLAEDTLDTSSRGDDFLVLVDRVCRVAGVAPMQLAAVAIGGGPGSFTGLRIGMATAKGIAFAAGCPLWITSSLAAMAAEVAEVAATRYPVSAARNSPLLVPVLDARRGEVFVGFYTRAAGGGALVSIAPERAMPPINLEAALASALVRCGDRPIHCCGDALAVHRDALALRAEHWLAAARTPSGAWVGRVALAGERHDEITSGRPAYLRQAEAEIKYPHGVPGALPRRLD